MHAVFGSAVSATAADLIPNTNDAVHGARTKNSDHKATFAIFQRVVGLSFGIATQAIFAWTAYHLFFFLKDGSTNSYAFHPFINAFLATFFAIPHSLLLWPRMRKWITRWLPPPSTDPSFVWQHASVSSCSLVAGRGLKSPCGT